MSQPAARSTQHTGRLACGSTRVDPFARKPQRNHPTSQGGGEGPTGVYVQWGSKPHITHGKGAILPLTVPCHRAIEVRAANPYRHTGDPSRRTRPPGVPPTRRGDPLWGAGPGVQTPPVRRESAQAALRPPHKWKHCIFVFNHKGELVYRMCNKGYGKSELCSPEGITFHPERSILYIADTGNNRIQILEKDGTYLDSIGPKNKNTGDTVKFRKTGPSKLNQPTDVAVTIMHVVVADSGNHKIKIFNHDGQILQSIGGIGTTKGLFRSPEVLKIDDKGYIIVGDAGNGRVQIFSPEGKFLQVLGDKNTQGYKFAWVSDFGWCLSTVGDAQRRQSTPYPLVAFTRRIQRELASKGAENAQWKRSSFHPLNTVSLAGILRQQAARSGSGLLASRSQDNCERLLFYLLTMSSDLNSILVAEDSSHFGRQGARFGGPALTGDLIDKDPDKSPSRPQALQAGKLLERIIATRIVQQLSRSDPNILEDQYEFRESRSTINAIRWILTEGLHREGGGGVALVISLNVVNVFNLPCPYSTRLLLGIPQGSILGPLLWIIIYNVVIFSIPSSPPEVTAQKTEAMFIHGFRKVPPPAQVIVGSVSITVGDLKYPYLKYRLTQVFTRRNCFVEYLCRIEKKSTTHCHHYVVIRDSAQHTLDICPTWTELRGVLVEKVGPDFSPPCPHEGYAEAANTLHRMYDKYSIIECELVVYVLDYIVHAALNDKYIYIKKNIPLKNYLFSNLFISSSLSL
ncbi:NHL1 protein, partial [Acromyrmex insinuator]